MTEFDWSTLKEVYQDSVFLQVLTTMVVALMVQIVLRYVLSKLVHRIVANVRHESRSDKIKREKTLKGVVYTLLAFFVWIFAIVMILGQIGVNVAALATGAGLFGIVFGFGAQSTVKDFVSGLFILGENQYRVGDIVGVQISGQQISGVVEEITIRITRLRDLDGNLHIVSNGTIEAVTNLSYKQANVNIDIPVGYDSDIDVIEKVINKLGEELAKDEDWSDKIIEPIAFLRLDAFDDSSIRIKALGVVQPGEQWAIAGEFRRRIKVEFDKMGIEIPFAQLVVHTKTPSDTENEVTTDKKKGK